MPLPPPPPDVPRGSTQLHTRTDVPVGNFCSGFRCSKVTGWRGNWNEHITREAPETVKVGAARPPTALGGSDVDSRASPAGMADFASACPNSTARHLGRCSRSTAAGTVSRPS